MKLTQVIAEARKRLLQEHGAKVAGYLPKVSQRIAVLSQTYGAVYLYFLCLYVFRSTECGQDGGRGTDSHQLHASTDLKWNELDTTL